MPAGPTLDIFGAIGDGPNTAAAVAAALAALDPAAPVHVRINSSGGSVQEAVAAFALLRQRGNVTTEVVGWALSAATLVLMAGDRRLMHSTTLLMVHAPWVGAAGNASQLRETADALDVAAASMRAAYRRTGRPETDLDRWLDGADHWFTAEDALAAGLVTEVLQADASVMPEAFAACRHPIPAHLAQRITAMTTTATSTPDMQAALALGARAEAKRRTDIRAAAAPFLTDPAVRAYVDQAEADTTVTPADAGLKILALVGKTAQPVGGSYTPSMADERMGEFKAAAVDALLQRAGVRVANPHPGAVDLQRMSIVSMAESLLSMAGHSRPVGGPGAVISAAMTTSDLPTLLQGVGERALQTAYREAPATHTAWTGVRSVPDFRPATLAQVSLGPDLMEKNEAGEYRYGSIGDSGTTFQVRTFGRILRVTRESLVNDDLQVLARLPGMMGQAAARLEADLCYDALQSSANLSDGLPAFHVSRGNLAATGNVLSVTALSIARAAMRMQRAASPNGVGAAAGKATPGAALGGFLDLMPAILLVPVALQTTAEVIVASTVLPNAANAQENPGWIRQLTVVADPRLDAASTLAWYLVSSPGQIDGVIRAYLNGQTQPFLESSVEFKSDDMHQKVRHDVSAGWIDPRAAYRNPGA